MRHPLKWRLLLLMISLSACVDEGEIRLYLVKSSDLNKAPLTESLTSHVRIRVEGPGMSPKEAVSPYRQGGSLTMPGILQGKNRVITVEGLFSEDGFVMSRGRSLPIDIGAGKQDVTIFIARVGRFSESPGNGLQRKLFGHTVMSDPSGMLIVASGASDGDALDPKDFIEKPTWINPMDMSHRVFDCSSCRLSKRVFGAMVPGREGYWLVGGRGPDGRLQDVVDYIDTTTETVTEADLKLLARIDMSSISFPYKTVIAGGRDEDERVLVDVEIITADGKVSESRFPEARYGMASGRAGRFGLFFGGITETGDVSSDVFLFDSESDQITHLEADLEARAFATAVSLSDGRLLLIGGQDAEGNASGAIDLFDPAIRTICPVGTLSFKRWFPAASLLPDGRVIVIGGLTGASPGQPAREAQVIDPTLTRIGSECAQIDTPVDIYSAEQASVPRYLATATLAQNSNIVLIGGFGGNHKPLQPMDVYIPQEF